MTLTGSVVDMSEEAVVHAGHFGLAVVGHALARHWLTDPEKVRARTEELRTILDGLDASVEPYSWELRVRELDVEAGYEQWAPIYDGPNPAIETETPIFRELLTTAPRGRALDAACGTGRHAGYLVELGYDVVGVDASSAMLEIARAKVPAARMELGMLESLPLEDDSVDLVTCSLALTHVPDLAPVMREFARVLRPGGQVLLSDMHPISCMHSGGAAFGDFLTDGIRFVPNIVHHVGDYWRAFTAGGLKALDCIEPRVTDRVIETHPTYPLIPEATTLALADMPFLLLWRLTLPA